MGWNVISFHSDELLAETKSAQFVLTMRVFDAIVGCMISIWRFIVRDISVICHPKASKIFCRT